MRAAVVVLLALVALTVGPPALHAMLPPIWLICCG